MRGAGLVSAPREFVGQANDPIRLLLVYQTKGSDNGVTLPTAYLLPERRKSVFELVLAEARKRWPGEPGQHDTFPVCSHPKYSEQFL